MHNMNWTKIKKRYWKLYRQLFRQITASLDGLFRMETNLIIQMKIFKKIKIKIITATEPAKFQRYIYCLLGQKLECLYVEWFRLVDVLEKGVNLL